MKFQTVDTVDASATTPSASSACKH
jgi:hypothetical protein